MEPLVIDNYVDAQCIRHVHLISNEPLEAHSPVWGEGEVVKEAGVWHFQYVRPYHGPLDVQAGDGIKFRRLVVWSYDGCSSVSDAIRQAEAEFQRLFGFLPLFIFIQRLPKGIHEWQEINGMILLSTEWMMDKCVAVGGMRS